MNPTWMFPFKKSKISPFAGLAADRRLVAGRREGRADGVEGAGETLGETGVAMGSLVVSPKPSLKVNGS